MCMRAEERPHRLRAREAELADQSRAVRVARDRTSTRRSGSTNGPSELAVKTLALDPSKGSDARRGDYSAFVMLGVDRQGMLYLEADLARRPTPADRRRRRGALPPVPARRLRHRGQPVPGTLGGPSSRRSSSRQGLLGARPWLVDNRVNKLVPHPPAGAVPGRPADALQERCPVNPAAGRAAPAVSRRRPRRRPRRRGNGHPPGRRAARAARRPATG